MHTQIASQIRQLVIDGDLRPLSKLPSTRHLSEQLGVSRATLTSAYDQLLAEGYLTAQIGSGTAVAKQLRGITYLGKPQAESVTQRGARDLPRTARNLEPLRQLMPPPLHRLFSVSTQGEEVSAGKVWERHVVSATRRLRLNGSYSGPQGLLDLRQAIVSHVRGARGVNARPEQVVMTSGAQQGLALAVKVLLARGDHALIEDPGYLPLRALLSDAGVKRIGMQVDAQGAAIPHPAKTGVPPRAMFLTPSHQYPLGMVLSMQRRFAALQWAEATGGWIVEDDYDSEFRYAGQPFPALQGLDRQGAVIYVGSFSKALSPSLRLGYVIVPDCLIDAFAGAKRLADLHSPLLEQMALESFISTGAFEAHVRRVRLIMQERHDALCTQLSRQVADELTLLPCDQGLFVPVQLNSGIDVEISARATEAGLTIRPLSPHFLRKPAMHGFMLGFSNLKVAEVPDAVSRLKAVLRAVN
ncbi:PLP-dependent aminotransferase family protein [Acidovorax sp. BLS4]|uniref:MocR-like pyridoxine biosynthesis transcription factor PdxR n=1 Tax=Acidovorax sp. BLS4 TaxID=3273430 RepID=UPI0029424F89|nr:PLP-dependent aminotransferase family protein [Paracidovorax avenae]WOI46840.1 PLP-dependent aminotransferase family protein [Paracidovorax avenae]